ncbi:hypothetical protein [Fictibacillus barbaricus]|uniref:RCK N-terminal domain-containing protein n=1 Tax=Fictibacillus barbaricus TaxID=182136 RepID=A0ABU1TX16_9BACL|nr:hypothetical protein [Fictibacillus barbaricus]MDR7071736.1 hypothetical protein [Fictibacillus barbaricus]
MTNEPGNILIMFPDKVSEAFITKLKMCDYYTSIVSCVPNSYEANRLLNAGFHSVYVMNYSDKRKLIEMVGPFIQKIIIVESGFLECCQTIELIRSVYTIPVYVIKTDTLYITRVYKELGADYVIHNKTGNIQFLLTS